MGDMNASGSVNGSDIKGFVDCALGGGSNCACGDFNSNGMVDSGDVAGFTAVLVP